MNLKQTSRVIDTKCLQYLIACRRDQNGQEIFEVTCSDKVFLFRSMSSVLDFIESNKGSIGYVS